MYTTTIILYMQIKTTATFLFILIRWESIYNNRIVNLARGVAYVGGQTGEGRAQAAGADGRRAQTVCGRE